MANMRQQAFIAEARQANQQVWDGINKLASLQSEWNALDYGSNLEDGDNAATGITAAEVGSVVFDTTNALKGVLAQGHATNMAKLL